MAAAPEARLAATYDALWAKGRDALSTGRIDPEPLPCAGTVRWGISAVLRPKPWPPALAACATACAALMGPTGVIYDEGNMHTTLRAIEGFRDQVPCDDGDVSAYGDVLDAVAGRTAPIRLRLGGLTATPAGILVQGWPSPGLQTFRQALHEGLAERGLASRGPETSRDSIRTTAHATLALYEGPVARPTALVDLIDAHRANDFGEWIFPELWLVGYRRTAGGVALIEYGRFAFGDESKHSEVLR